MKMCASLHSAPLYLSLPLIQKSATQFLKHLDDRNEDVRESAFSALASLATYDDEVRAQFFNHLDDHNIGVRRAAFRALEPLAASDAEVRAQFLNHLDDHNISVRRSAFELLSHSLPPIQKSVPNSSTTSTIKMKMCAVPHSMLLRPSLPPTQKSAPNSSNTSTIIMKMCARSALSALASLALSDVEVLKKLKNLFSENEWQIRKATVDVLAQSLHQPQLIMPIVKLLNNSLDILSVAQENCFTKSVITALEPLVASDAEVRTQIPQSP